VTALASAYADTPARRDTAMTGEITLSGLVLPVGGIKEKVLAAHRAGIKRIIMPERNKKDLHDVPEQAKKEMEFIFAHSMDDVLVATMEENPFDRATKAAQTAKPAQPAAASTAPAAPVTTEPAADPPPAEEPQVRA
jgi:ATP-dependent Lon protease